MIRQPTSKDDALAWWRNGLKGMTADEQIYSEEPQSGWYKTRLVRLGPFVPARIWIEAEIDRETGELLGDETLQCEVNGQHADAEQQWPWLCQNPITEAEYRYMTALRQHVGWYEPDHPTANPRQSVDWTKVPTPQFNKENGNG